MTWSFNELYEILCYLVADPADKIFERDTKVAAFNEAQRLLCVSSYADYFYFLQKVAEVDRLDVIDIGGKDWARFLLPADVVKYYSFVVDGSYCEIYSIEEARSKYDIFTTYNYGGFIKNDHYLLVAPASAATAKVYYLDYPTEWQFGVNDDAEPDYPKMLRFAVIYLAASLLLKRVEKSPAVAENYKRVADMICELWVRWFR